ncbi:MAG: hypothetical protein HXY22_00600 [Alphaproteobacteria bacterium]|nr:hypothetical protein [Alphaproteobacteria bacterium]
MTLSLSRLLDYLALAAVIATFLLWNNLGAGLIFGFAITIVGIPIAILIAALPAIALWLGLFRLASFVLGFIIPFGREWLAAALAMGFLILPDYQGTSRISARIEAIDAANAAQAMPRGEDRSLTLIVFDGKTAEAIFTHCRACRDGLIAGRFDRLQIASAYDAFMEGKRDFEARSYAFAPSSACNLDAARAVVADRSFTLADIGSMDATVFLRGLAGNCFVESRGTYHPSGLIIAIPRLGDGWMPGMLRGLSPSIETSWSKFYENPVTLMRQQGGAGQKTTEIAYYGTWPGPYLALPYFVPIMGAGIPTGIELAWFSETRQQGVWSIEDLSLLIERVEGPIPPYGILERREDVARATAVILSRPGEPDEAERAVVERFLFMQPLRDDPPLERELREKLASDPRFQVKPKPQRPKAPSEKNGPRRF